MKTTNTKTTSKKILSAIAVSTIILLANTSISAEIYKWTDAKGVVHYSAQKPTQKKVKSENIEKKIRSAAGQHRVAKKATPATSKQPTKNVGKKDKAKLSGPNPELQAYCDSQRGSLKQLQNNYRNIWKDMDGKKTKLDQKQRQDKVDYLQNRIAEDCSDV